MKIERSDTGT